MHSKNKEPIETRLQKLKSENQSLREKIAYYKREFKKYDLSIKKRDLLFHSIPAGIVLIQQGKVIETNDAVLMQLGYRHEEVIGRNFLDFVHPDLRSGINELLNLWISGKNGPDQFEACFIKKDNHSILYDIMIKSVRFNNRKALLLNLIKLEKRKELEKANIRSKKMEALITMAVGLKDQLRFHNDSLMDSITDLKGLSDQWHTDPLYALEEFENNSRKLFTIAGELEILAGLVDYGQGIISFDLNECVKKAVSSRIEELKDGPESQGKKIELKTYLRSSSLITGDPEGIKQVIIHMIKNAVESMPDGGDILITTEDNAGSAHIYIQDSGIGISEENMERVFDPFFTTKGHGSKGLGLSLSHAIIKRHKGNIEISGQEGHGIMVHILLPIIRRESVSRHKIDRMKIEEAQILIIQKEDVTRELISHLLFNKGCKVDTAADGLEGLGKLKRKNFDLMIADVEAFHLEEDIFVKKCKALHPDLSIVLITGDEESLNPNPDHERLGDLNIIKPLVINRLVRQVTELLTAK